MPELITSRSNPIVKQVRALRQRKERDASGLFLVEGLHHVGEAVEAGWDVERLVYAPDLLTSDFGLRLLDEQSRRGVHLAALTGELFAALADKDNPQGLLALVHQRHLTLEHLTPDRSFLAAACVSPQDPGNVGTILRTLEAVGADGLFLLEGGVDPYHPSCIRASMGTIFWLPLVQTSFDDFVSWLRTRGVQLVGSSAHAAQHYRTFERSDRPTILLLGSEQKGLSQEQLAACEVCLSLPMRGRASSLNLAVSAGVLLYQMIAKK
jgi:TrmH family RNA methyltransferase